MQSVGISLTRLLRSQVLQKLRSVTNTAFSTKYLFFTNVGISISLSAVGDVLEQNYEILTGDLDKYSLKRTHHMSLSGLTVGIICHHWYKYLDKRMPGRTLRLVLKKMVVDQLVCSPICLSVFFLTLAVLEKPKLDEFKEEFKEKAWKLYAAEWVIWPPAQVVNFYLLPAKYRVLYDNTISLGYDVYMSHVKHNSDRRKEEPTENITND